MEAAVQAEMAKIKSLHWTGTAHMPFTPKPLDLVIETHVVPFGHAWTSSYKRGETPDRARRLRIDGDKAFYLVEDLESDLPPQQARHEREQYGLYGYLLKTLIREKLIAAQVKPERLFLTRDMHPGLPPIEFRWDVRAQRIGEAAYNVHKPFGDGMIYQQIQFSGEVGSADLHWPRTIDIAQDGKPYFKLVIDSFTIQPA